MAPDNKKEIGKADRRRISIKQSYEVRYWAKKFGVSQAQLKGAVEIVGHMVTDVKAYFKLKRSKRNRSKHKRRK